MSNIFTGIPSELDAELCELLVDNGNVRVERIVSQGHASPETGWYDQKQNEWVIVLQGEALLEFADGSTKRLIAGDYITIEAHVKHKVNWTDPDMKTIWLAIHY
ncbi:MAG: cupin domain-containing protein [Proteobacteria bacterium]|nr:cupin domain-containing protein [Pseudomonadota bacterium]